MALQTSFLPARRRSPQAVESASAVPPPAAASPRPSGQAPAHPSAGVVPTPSSAGPLPVPQTPAPAQAQATPTPSPQAAAWPQVGTLGGGFHSVLTYLMGMDPSKINLNDPALKAQLVAFQNANQRGLENTRRGLGERYASMGLTRSGAADQAHERALQSAGEAEAQFTGDLFAQELVSRRNMLMQALQVSGQYLSEQERTAVQAELGRLDAAIRKYGIDVQKMLGLGALDLDRSRLGFDIGRFQQEQNNLIGNYF